MFRQKKIDYSVAICTAVASHKICKSLGLKSFFEFPYCQYKYHGREVFKSEMCDGSKCAYLMLGNV